MQMRMPRYVITSICENKIETISIFVFRFFDLLSPPLLWQEHQQHHQSTHREESLATSKKHSRMLSPRSSAAGRASASGQAGPRCCCGAYGTKHLDFATGCSSPLLLNTAECHCHGIGMQRCFSYLRGCFRSCALYCICGTVIC